jgi:hypothetical protein
MAKIGQMFLQHGVWDGEQIVSTEWVEESTSMSVQLSNDVSPVFRETGYGYQWWRGRFANGETDVIFAGGWGGQFIFIVPEFDMVVVLTGSDFSGNYITAYEVVNRYILGSIIGYPEGGGIASYGVTLKVPEDYEKVIAIHSGPGDTYPVVGKIEKGAAISIIGFDPKPNINDSWLQVSPSGWVALKDVDLVAQGVVDINQANMEDLWLTGNLANLPVINESSLFSRLWPTWNLLLLLSLVFVVWRLARGQITNRRTWLVWILVAVFLGPFGLLANMLVNRKRRAVSSGNGR